MATFIVWNWMIPLLYVFPAILGIFVFRQRPVRLRNTAGGVVKVGRLGWSWTYFYFGFWVPLFRSEIGIAALHLLFTIVTFGLFQLVWSFLYNKQHMTRLLTSGWEIDDSDEVEQFVRRKLMPNG
tara:strand:- start:238 stop:612 length:375 start_codon:yes stop_codon:yes gene_type:complete